MSDKKNSCPFDVAIFDLDGVITKTARVHARAWKLAFDEYLRLREKRNKEPFKEFTYEGDYLPYVDGKPRYKGVQSFLESRGINIPFGEPSDAADKESVCGVGNRKNDKFRQALKEKGVEVFSSSVDFIKDLRKRKIPVGLVTSSKNCRYILESAGLNGLFDTIVDGVVTAEMGLKGKPEGDIFVKAAYDLGTTPARSVVFEDATSGVQAGRNGGFGFVVGIARENNESDLLENGADMAIKDMSFLRFPWLEEWFRKKPLDLFSFWDKPAKTDIGFINEIDNKNVMINPRYSLTPDRLFNRNKKNAFFLDYDGTLTPIVQRPELAVISDEMKGMVEQVSKKYFVAIVSGRMREDVEQLAQMKDITYAGSHGFDIKGPQLSMIQPEAEKAKSLISAIIKQLKGDLTHIKGILIEEKKFSVAVHFRLVEKDHVPRIKEYVDTIIKNNPSLRMMSGKKVFEILPRIDWDKGKAIRWIMEALQMDWNKYHVIYLGDDTTDEDAFRVIRTRGTGILVSKNTKISAADFRIDTVNDVKKLFEKLLV